MNEVLETLDKIGIVPVIKIDDAGKAVPLAEALQAGGIPCAEITFRTAQGEEAIRRIAQTLPDVLIGAGTVLTTKQVDRAIDAGARFVVSPGFNPAVVSYCLKKEIPIVPGCSTPSDMELALEAGLDTVKFFPAEQAGGLDYIKAVSSPFSSLRFMPTGGINAENIGRYIAFEKILACGGSWMAPADLINAGKFEEIARLCREAVYNMLRFSVAHMGINTENEDEARKTSESFGNLFGLTLKPGNGSLFAGDFLEVMKSPNYGAHGHIAIRVNSITKARYHLERQGYAFSNEGIKTDAKGRMTVIYLKDEIAGFAVHLLQKT
jgi:2-dehydro-3-deoxyphosphogluconate aldolase/(4S)-4-hydroxy-2-oxoglutarate aldolase